MTFPLTIPEPLRRLLQPGTGVLLGLSGGVDSAVTLALLRALECDVQCVTFKNFCYGEGDIELTDKSCCSLEAIEDARKLARSFDSPHWVGDVEKPFRTSVIDPFIAEYSSARTPNPCLDCNGSVRFPELVRLAERQGCALAATGHYARIDHRAQGAALLSGLDPAKDQSYFLHRIDRRLYERIVFPLGWFTKDQVRQAARELGLEVASKRDSQEICFVPDGDRSFLFPDSPARQAGDIVDRAGRVLGRHRGLIHYTVGQRRGLGIAAERPLYVLALELETRRVVVGYEEELRVLKVEATDFLAAVPDFPALGDGRWRDDQTVAARIRHRHAGAPIHSWRLDGDRFAVKLAEPVSGVAPGQGLVLYAGDMVLGGGRITGPFAEPEVDDD